MRCWIWLVLAACNKDAPVDSDACVGCPATPGDSEVGRDSEAVHDSPVDSAPAHTGDTAPGGPSLGDPLLELGHTRTSLYEFIDVAYVAPDRALLVGQRGWAVLDTVDGELLRQAVHERGFKLTVDESTGIAWVATRDARGIYALETDALLDGPEAPPLIALPDQTWHEDIAADGGVLLVAAQDLGGILFDARDPEKLDEIARLPSTYAYGAELVGDRALLTDGTELVLWDVSDPAHPAELHRLDIGHEGRDIDLQGDRVAVALGGAGAIVLDLLADTLIPGAPIEAPGSVFSVSLDGDRLWVAAWTDTVLVDISGDEPVVISHEAGEEIVLGVAGRDGRAAVADWRFASSLQHIEGVSAPEIETARFLYVDGELGGSWPVSFYNAGPVPLTVQIALPEIGGAKFALSDTELVVESGDWDAIFLDVAPGAEDMLLSWSSDDPDEPQGTIDVSTKSASLGTPHPDFTLAGFVPPDRALDDYTLSEQRGQPVLLIYFATW